MPILDTQSTLDALFAEDEFRAPDGTVFARSATSVTRNEGLALYEMVRAIRPSNSLEIGCALGTSTACICLALRENGSGRHCMIDDAQTTHWKSIGLSTLERYSLGGLADLHQGISQQILPKMLAEGRRFQFAFIDGLHVFDWALVDFFFIHQMLDVGGVVAFHDCWLPGISKILGLLRTNFDYEVVNLPPSRGLGLRWRWQKLARGARALARFACGDGEVLHVHHPRYSPRGLGVLRKLSEQRTDQDDFVDTW